MVRLHKMPKMISFLMRFAELVAFALQSDLIWQQKHQCGRQSRVVCNVTKSNKKQVLIGIHYKCDNMKRRVVCYYFVCIFYTSFHSMPLNSKKKICAI